MGPWGSLAALPLLPQAASAVALRARSAPGLALGEPAASAGPELSRAGNIVDLCICLASVLGACGIILPYVLSKNSRKLRHSLILGLAVSDLVSSLVIIVSTAFLLEGGDLGRASALCDFVGYALAVSIFTQHCWNLCIAVITYMIVVRSLSTFVYLAQRFFILLWPIIWALALVINGIAWGLSGWVNAGGFCSVGPKAGPLFSPLLMFVPRGIVVVVIIVLYTHLFFWLRRSTLFSGAHTTGSFGRTSGHGSNREVQLRSIREGSASKEEPSTPKRAHSGQCMRGDELVSPKAILSFGRTSQTRSQTGAPAGWAKEADAGHGTAAGTLSSGFSELTELRRGSGQTGSSAKAWSSTKGGVVFEASCRPTGGLGGSGGTGEVEARDAGALVASRSAGASPILTTNDTTLVSSSSAAVLRSRSQTEMRSHDREPLSPSPASVAAQSLTQRADAKITSDSTTTPDSSQWSPGQSPRPMATLASTTSGLPLATAPTRPSTVAVSTDEDTGRVAAIAAGLTGLDHASSIVAEEVKNSSEPEDAPQRDSFDSDALGSASGAAGAAEGTDGARLFERMAPRRDARDFNMITAPQEHLKHQALTANGKKTVRRAMARLTLSSSHHDAAALASPRSPISGLSQAQQPTSPATLHRPAAAVEGTKAKEAAVVPDADAVLDDDWTWGMAVGGTKTMTTNARRPSTAPRSSKRASFAHSHPLPGRFARWMPWRRASEAHPGRSDDGRGGAGGVLTGNTTYEEEHGVEALGSTLNRQASVLMLLYPLAYVVLFSVSIGRIIFDLVQGARGVSVDQTDALHSIARWLIFAQGAWDFVIFSIIERAFRLRIKRRRAREAGQAVPDPVWLRWLKATFGRGSSGGGSSSRSGSHGGGRRSGAVATPGTTSAARAHVPSSPRAATAAGDATPAP